MTLAAACLAVVETVVEWCLLMWVGVAMVVNKLVDRVRGSGTVRMATGERNDRCCLK